MSFNYPLVRSEILSVFGTNGALQIIYLKIKEKL